MSSWLIINPEVVEGSLAQTPKSKATLRLPCCFETEANHVNHRCQRRKTLKRSLSGSGRTQSVHEHVRQGQPQLELAARRRANRTQALQCDFRQFSNGTKTFHKQQTSNWYSLYFCAGLTLRASPIRVRLPAGD